MIRLALCGDVMLGRGIDQLLPRPGDPGLHEQFVGDARDYLTLAEHVAGPLPRTVDPAYPWGEALAVLEEAAPDLRLLNLETAVTADGHPAPGKAVHYRMHPGNVPALRVARPDACALANNHVLDFGPVGLLDTLTTLRDAGLPAAGAGRDGAEAWRPVAVPLSDGGRVLVLSVAFPTSGVPAAWAAGAGRPGVALVEHPSRAAAEQVVGTVARRRRDGDVVVVSVHWGSNWGHEVSRAQRDFAHALIDGGVDLVHGHSSHHARPVEVYRDRLVLHGCGDLVNDYEGIRGHERFRPDLRLLWLADLDPRGRLGSLRMVPLRSHRLRLTRAGPDDTRWLCADLDRACRPHGTRITSGPEGDLQLA